MRPVEGTILTVVRSIAEAVEALDAPSLVAMLERGRGGRRATRSRARPICFRCCARPAWSTRAARASRCCSTRCSKWSTAVRSPSPSSSTTPAAVAAHLAGDDDVSGLRYEVMYLLDAPRLDHPGVSRGVGRDRRLDRRGRRRRHLELSRAHQRHRRRGRSRHRRRPPALDPRHRPDGTGGRGALGARGRGRRRPHRRARVDDAPSPPRSSRSASATVCGGCSRVSACRRVDRRRSVDEPVDRADPRSGRGVRAPTA